MTSVITYVCGNIFQELPHNSSCIQPESCLQTKRWMKKFSPLVYGFKTHRRIQCVQDHMLQNLPMSVFYFCLKRACRNFLLATTIEWMTCPCVYSHQQRINLYCFADYLQKAVTSQTTNLAQLGDYYVTQHYKVARLISKVFSWNQLYKYRTKLQCFRDCFFSVIRTWHDIMYSRGHTVLLC